MTRAEPAAHPPRRSRAELLAPRRCAWSAARRRTCSPRSPPASARSGARSTAAPTRKSSRCSRRSRPTAATSRSSSTLAKDKNSNFRLMGFGHRVYKNFDPRAKIIKSRCDAGPRASSASRTRCSTSRSSSKRRRSRTVLRRAQALPERRLLLRHHLPRARLPHEHVHGDVRPRAPARAGSPTGRR